MIAGCSTTYINSKSLTEYPFSKAFKKYRYLLGNTVYYFIYIASLVSFSSPGK